MFELDSGEVKSLCFCVCVCMCFKYRLAGKRMKMENEKGKWKLYCDFLKIKKYHLSILELNLNIIYSLRV